MSSRILPTPNGAWEPDIMRDCAMRLVCELRQDALKPSVSAKPTKMRKQHRSSQYPTHVPSR